jgi:tetratricopeptide (TPR) repeat protein
MTGAGSKGENASPLPAPAPRPRRWLVWTSAGVLAAAMAAVTFAWRPPPRTPTPAPAGDESEPEEPSAVNPGYVGSEACAACHARRVAEFRNTRHFLACRPAQAATMPPGFAPGRGDLATREPGLRFEMTQAGGGFVQTVVRTTATGEEKTSVPIDLVYGSGGDADEMYFSWREDYLRELPIGWLHPQQRWGVVTYDPHGEGDLSREATTRCLECHNTYFEHVAGTRNRYRRESFLPGIGCERCHGPGREHVAFHQAHPEVDSTRGVVHPGHLSRDRMMEVCTQCHSNAVKGRTPPFRYRPGEPLEAYFRTTTSQYPENDHVANQVKYLRQSKCFQKSETLTCVTCHNPHRPTGPAAVQRACLTCHQPAHCADAERLPQAVRNQCVDCHMPARTWMNVHFHTEDDQYVPPIRRREHRIAVHATARQEVLLAWYRRQTDADSRREADLLTEELVEHWRTEAGRRRHDYRFLAAIGAAREALRLESAPATLELLQELVQTQARIDSDLVEALHQIDRQHFPEAVATLNRILSVKPDLAVAHAKLGTVYAALGQNEQAVEHLQAVARHDPDDPHGYMMLGWLAYLQGRAEDAVAAYRRADEVEPFSAKINYHLGLALAQLDRYAEAIPCFRQVLVIDPQHAGGCQALSHALRRQGRGEEALPFARRAARLTQYQNPDVLVTLAETYADLGRFTDAADIASQALPEAQRTSPNLVPQIRTRLEELRQRAEQEESAKRKQDP